MPDFLDYQHIQAFLMSVARQTVWLLLLAVIFLPLERLFAIHPRKFFSRTLASDIGFYFISGLVPSLLLAPPLALVATAAHAMVPWTIQNAIAHTPLWFHVIAALLVSEIGFYWGHRWMHEIPALWRFHAVHHHPDQVYFLISARAHPFDNAFIRLCGFVPVTALGLATPLTPSGGAVAALLVLAFTVWGFLIHANIRWRFGPLEWVISTPCFHHWHHTLAEPRDRNYASMLPFLDWIFGTAYLPRDKWPDTYGTVTPIPASLPGQLLYPFIGTDPPLTPGPAQQTRESVPPAPPPTAR